MSLFDKLSDYAVRHLDQKHLSKLREGYLSLRTRMAPLMKRVYGNFNADQLQAHLTEHVDERFEILMVHSSMNKLAPMFTGSPLELVRMLIEFCGPERTLVMPAFYFGDPNVGGNNATFAADPHFDLRRTPSQMGLATELFRRTPGVVQSRHPVYRIAALGPLAEKICAGHENADSPAGAGTPFAVMAEHNATILGIGKSIEVLTQVHHAEDLMGADFPVPSSPRRPLPVTIIDGDRKVAAALNGREIAWRRDMFRLRRILPKGELREWCFHHVPMFTAHAGSLTHALLDAAARGETIYVNPDHHR